ncbi:nitroreductase family protein [Leucobacter sp. cx-42]|uniref:nitroreductase family protein n=1 Tax=unclassified Leucobacter TaxID=2621730 RepID=UPI00165E4B5B|nr:MULTISPECIES: nitroreductase family protein [unclassified Leucobacter]MBC9954092.1 nitroreductase family protein [Leucobacter sp. cx-42]
MKTSLDLYLGLSASVEAASLEIVDLLQRQPSTDAAGNSASGFQLSALQSRRAVKRFTTSTIKQSLLTTISQRVQQLDQNLWPRQAIEVPLQSFVIARNVENASPGIYKIDVSGLELATEHRSIDVQEFVLQPEFASAAAIVFLIGSLKSAHELDGDHGYRLLLERSGAAAEVAWMSAVENGVSGSIFAGLVPSTLKQLLGVDGFKRVQTIAIAIGYPTEERSAAT